MSTPLKYIKKGSVARFREFYKKTTKKPLTSEQRKELLEVFKKKDKSEADQVNQKKIARSDQDLGI
jgi:hypothetical protein